MENSHQKHSLSYLDRTGDGSDRRLCYLRDHGWKSAPAVCIDNATANINVVGPELALFKQLPEEFEITIPVLVH